VATVVCYCLIRASLTTQIPYLLQHGAPAIYHFYNLGDSTWTLELPVLSPALFKESMMMERLQHALESLKLADAPSHRITKSHVPPPPKVYELPHQVNHELRHVFRHN
jgi:hypothetical protein